MAAKLMRKKPPPKEEQMEFGPQTGQSREDWLKNGIALAIYNFEKLQEQFEELQKMYREVKRERDDLMKRLFK